MNKILCKCVDEVLLIKDDKVNKPPPLGVICVEVKKRFLDPMTAKRLPKKFNMAIDPKVIITEFAVLRAFSSKKVPLWIMSKSTQQLKGDNFPSLFKNGDDMR